MKFSLSVDIALRSLVLLAEKQVEEPELRLSAPKISEILGISYNNMVRILGQLQNASLVQSQTGRNGGVRLLHSPDKISIRRVVEAIDGPTQLSSCILSPQSCSSNEHCSIQYELFALSNQVDQLLDGVSIAAIIERRSLRSKQMAEGKLHSSRVPQELSQQEERQIAALTPVFLQSKNS